MTGEVTVFEKTLNGKRILLRVNHFVPFQFSLLRRAWLTFYGRKLSVFYNNSVRTAL
jgi:hypothetical protein